MVEPRAHVVESGEPNGLPVVFVHGMGVDHRSLMLLDEAFATGGGASGDGSDRDSSAPPTRRLYLDLPGFGRTPALPPSACGLQDMADWLRAAIDDLLGERARFALVGNSMGGALVRDVLARRPGRVAGLALIAPVIDPHAARRRLGEHVVDEPNPELMHALPMDQTIDFIAMGVNQSFAAWRRYQRFIMPGMALCDRDACARLERRYWLAADPERAFGVYDGPTLMVTGMRDQIVGFEDQRDLMTHYPNGVFAAIDDAGHNVHIDRPERVAELMRAWAGRLDDRAHQCI